MNTVFINFAPNIFSKLKIKTFQMQVAIFSFDLDSIIRLEKNRLYITDTLAALSLTYHSNNVMRQNVPPVSTTGKRNGNRSQLGVNVYELNGVAHFIILFLK